MTANADLARIQNSQGFRVFGEMIDISAKTSAGITGTTTPQAGAAPSGTGVKRIKLSGRRGVSGLRCVGTQNGAAAITVDYALWTYQHEQVSRGGGSEKEHFLYRRIGVGTFVIPQDGTGVTGSGSASAPVADWLAEWFNEDMAYAHQVTFTADAWFSTTLVGRYSSATNLLSPGSGGVADLFISDLGDEGGLFLDAWESSGGNASSIEFIAALSY